jgi:N-acylneuraminate cytidylyltransferase
MVSGPSIAVIPARGGSTRIPKKNIVQLGGKPLISWTIEAALDSQVFDAVIVSTDDPGIAEVSRRSGAWVPFLRERYADDTSPVSLASCETLKEVETRERKRFQFVAQLLPSCPLRTSEDIVRAMEAFGRSGAQFQISCFRYGWMNPWWAFKMSETGQAEKVFPQAYHERSQDLPPLYCPSGAIWIAEVNHLLEQGSFYGPGFIGFELPWDSAIDIDDDEDLRMAHALLAMRKERESRV